MIHNCARYFLIPSLLVASLLAPTRGLAQDSAPATEPAPMTLSEIVANMTKHNAERARDLEHYQGKRDYRLDYKGFPDDMHAEMVVLVSYSAPSTEEFTVISESGSKLILNRVIKPILQTEQESIEPANRERVQITPGNYDFTLLASEDDGDGCPYVLSVEPKVPNKFLFRGRIWVDAKDFAVCRIEAEPAKNPSFWIKSTAIHHFFRKVGDFWLPAENSSTSDIRLGGRATLTIKYEDYQVQAAPRLQAVASLPPVSSPSLPPVSSPSLNPDLPPASN